METTGGMDMKKWAAWLLILWLLPALAQADIALQLTSETVAVESVVDFSLEGDEAESYRYTLYRGGKELFKTEEIPYSFGSYLPREGGEYTLRAEAQLPYGWESMEAHFTVTPPLTFDLPPLSPAIRAGDGVEIAVSPKGGSGRYRCLYTLEKDEEVILEQEAGTEFLWVPQQEGDYTLTVLVTDGLDAFAQRSLSIPVSPGPGISWKASGGQLLASGGQKSWQIFAPVPWTATAESEFIHILRGEGQPGDMLIVEIEEETDAFRKGAVTLQSGEITAMLPVSQSAEYGVEEDLSLQPRVASVFVEGQRHFSWHNAKGTLPFAITAEGPWQVNTDDSFIHSEIKNDQLILSLELWDGEGVRSGTVMVESGKDTAYIHLYQVGEQKEKIPLPEKDPFPVPDTPESAFVIYSQCSGYWKDKAYRTSNLEKSGCAVFSLAHALQHLGYTGTEIRPEILAQTYAFALVQGGTMNDILVGHAGDDFGYKTRYDLYTDLPTIRSRMDQGAVYSFGVVTGHIAMIIEKNEEGTMFRVVDSAPSATWERIKNASLYLQDDQGEFYPITDLSQIPGIRYYIETQSFGGATYWLKDSYIAKRGVRLIQPK